MTEAEILADEWIKPDDGKVPFGKYAEEWVDERADLRPKTVELYRYLLRRHISPTFGTKALAEIKEAHVRRWRKKLLDDGASAVTAAKAYRLLKAIFATATDDGMIQRNPCRIKGQAKRSQRSGLSSPSPRSSRSPRRSTLDTGPWCSWARSPACDGASCARYAERTSTWTRGRYGWNAP